MWKSISKHLLLKAARDNFHIDLPHECIVTICDCAWYAFAGDSALFMSAEELEQSERLRLKRVGESEAYGDVADIDDSEWEAENDLTWCD